LSNSKAALQRSVASAARKASTARKTATIPARSILMPWFMSRMPTLKLMVERASTLSRLSGRC